MDALTGNDEQLGLKNRVPVDWVDLVRSQIRSLRFGVVQIVVHNSRVVQIEKTEKVRLDQRCPDSTP